MEKSIESSPYRSALLMAICRHAFASTGDDRTRCIEVVGAGWSTDELDKFADDAGIDTSRFRDYSRDPLGSEPPTAECSACDDTGWLESSNGWVRCTSCNPYTESHNEVFSPTLL